MRWHVLRGRRGGGPSTYDEPDDHAPTVYHAISRSHSRSQTRPNDCPASRPDVRPAPSACCRADLSSDGSADAVTYPSTGFLSNGAADPNSDTAADEYADADAAATSLSATKHVADGRAEALSNILTDDDTNCTVGDPFCLPGIFAKADPSPRAVVGAVILANCRPL